MEMTALGAHDIGLSDLAFAMEFEDAIEFNEDAIEGGDALCGGERHRCLTNCPAEPAPGGHADIAGAGPKKPGAERPTNASIDVFCAALKGLEFGRSQSGSLGGWDHLLLNVEKRAPACAMCKVAVASARPTSHAQASAD